MDRKVWEIWLIQHGEIIVSYCLFIVCLFFPPLIYFTSHLYCITRFEDEDAICRINIRLLTVERRGWSLL